MVEEGRCEHGKGSQRVGYIKIGRKKEEKGETENIRDFEVECVV